MITDINLLQSKTIDFLRFTLIIGVVFIHSPDIVSGTVNLQSVDYTHMSGMDIYSLISSLFSYVLTCIAVPLFFMISGFLFFYKLKEWNKDVYLKKITGRVKTLLVPYLLWNILALLVICVEDLMAIRGGGKGQLIGTAGLVDYIRGFFIWNGYSPYLNPMWFIRDLMVLCLLSPIFYYLLKYLKLAGIILFFALYYFNFWPNIIGFAPEATFYFVFGAYLSINKINLVQMAQKLKVPCLTMYICTLFTFFYTKGEKPWEYIDNFHVFSGIIIIIYLTSYLLKREKIKVHPFLTKASFFIFALHQLILLGAWRRIYLLLINPSTPIAFIAGYFFIPIITIITCLIVYYILQQYLPTVSNILTGYRTNKR